MILATRATYLAAALLAIACDKPGASTTATTSSTASSISTPTPISTPTSAPTPSASAAESPPDAIIAQHILVAYRGAKNAPRTITRTKPDAKKRAEEARAKVTSGTPFEDAVKQYSDDAGTVDRMGSLGKFRRDAMDASFAAAAFALEVGEVSAVVETPFGFHVIKRTQ